MTEPASLQRPRQVAVIGWFAIIASLLLVASVFDAMSAVRSVDSRRNLESLLSKSPWSGLGLSVDEATDLLRMLVLLTGALAAAAFVLAIYVLRRHNGARIAFTFTAGLLLLSAPVAGFLPITLAVAAAMLWSPAVRDWFAGRRPVEERAGGGAFRQTPPAPPEPFRTESRPPGPGAQQPEQPSPQDGPSASPPPSPYPYGEAPGVQAPVQPTPPPGYGYPPQAYPPPPGYGYPPQGYYPPGAVPGQPPVAPAGPTKRPATITVAAILTWVFTGLTAVFSIVIGVIFASMPESLTDQINEDPAFQDLGMTEGELVAIMLVLVAIGVLWCVAAFVTAIFMYRGAGWARVVLTVSASAAAVVSLLMILSFVSAITLLASVAVIVLMFTGGANAWFTRNRGGDPNQPQPQLPVW